MYVVEIENDGIRTTIHGDSEKLRSGKVVKGINAIDSFSFSLLPSNAGWGRIFEYKTRVSVYNTTKKRYEFIGRALCPNMSMAESGLISSDVTCESVLGYLRDSQQTYAETQNWTVRGLLQHMIDRHNARTEEYKHFTVGTVTATDKNDNLYLGIQRKNTWETIKEKLLDNIGGELQVRVVDGVNYLDYLEHIGGEKETSIALSKNMKSITREKDSTAIVTRLIPLGAKLGDNTEERLDISTVNGGMDYIDDAEAISLYGIRESVEEFDDVTTPEMLLTKGRNWLKNNNRVQVKYQITALDLSLLGLDIDDLDVGNSHPLENSLLSIDDVARINKKTVDVCEEVKSTIEVGDNFKTLSEMQMEQRKQLLSATQNIKIIESVTNDLKGQVTETKETVATFETSINQSSETVEAVAKKTVELEGRVEEAESVMRQTAEGFENTVKKDEVISSINQTAEEVKIAAEKIAFDGEMSLTGSFTTTAEVFLEPGQDELDTISTYLEQGLWEYGKDETLYDRDGDGFVTSDDYQSFWDAMNGKKSLADGWDKAVKSTVTITIEAANPQKTIRIQGVNMWGRVIDAYIGANGISSASNIDMHGGKVKNLSWDLDLESNDAISKYFADTHYAPNGYGYGTTAPKYIEDANNAIVTGFYLCPGGMANVPAGFEGGMLECQAFGPKNYSYYCIQIIRNDNSVATRYGNASYTGATVTWSDWRDITYGIPKVGNELVSPVDIKAPNLLADNPSGSESQTGVKGKSGHFYMYNHNNDGACGLYHDAHGEILTVYDNGTKAFYGNATSAGYATSAGNADTIDGYHASAFARVSSPNNLLHSGNEFTYVSPGFSGGIWHNYRTSDGNANGDITEYYFGNGKGGFNDVSLYAGNFYGKLYGREYRCGSIDVPAYSTSGSNGSNYYGDVSVSATFDYSCSSAPRLFLQVATNTTGVIGLEPVSWDKNGIYTIRIHRSSPANGVSGFTVYYLAVC